MANMWPLSRIVAAFVLIRSIFLTVRIALLLDSPSHSDYLHFFLLARQVDDGLLPYIHYWLEYPPLFPWLSTAVYYLSAFGVSGEGSEALFYVAIGLILMSAEIGVFVMIYRLSSLLWEQPTPLHSMSLYGLLFLPYYLWSGSFDPLPTLLLLVGLNLLLVGRTKVSALVAALGFCTKLFPAILLPIALCCIAGWKQKLIYFLTFSLTALVVFLPLAVISPSMMAASLQAFWLRPPWETVWALAQDYYGWGYIGPLPARTRADVWASVHADSEFWWIILLVAILFFLFCGKFWNSVDRYKIVPGVAFALSLLLLYSKGHSPQYLLWLAPYVAILFPNRFGVGYLVVLGLANLIEAPLYFGFFPGQTELLFVAVALRTICLSVLMFHCLYLSVGAGALTRNISMSHRRLTR